MNGLWQAGRLILRPSGHGQQYSVEVADDAGATLATCEPDGTIRDASGAAFVGAPLSWEGQRDKPTGARVELAAPDGRQLGAIRVTKYGIGPRAKKATLEATDAQGALVLRLEPRDKRGEELVLTEGDTEVATVRIEQVKTGFLRKARVYTVDLSAPISEPVRPLALATLIRYDVILNAVASAAARD